MKKHFYVKVLCLPRSAVVTWRRLGGAVGVFGVISERVARNGLLGFSRRAAMVARRYFAPSDDTVAPPAKEVAWINEAFCTKAPEYVEAPAANVPSVFDSQAPDAKLIAFYLPQFHPFPENDTWWGKGFTEWRNVTSTLPKFIGHHQPHLPADLGFYDLRTPDIMPMQAALAKHYGIYGFCFYFYWFAGTVLMETPLRRWRNDAAIDFPFCLCWANENWTRRWDGLANDILIAQEHSADDDLAFIEHVSPYLLDARYIRIGNKPVLLVYSASSLPNAAETCERWRVWWRARHGGELMLICVHSRDRLNPLDIGFDTCVEFPPIDMQVSDCNQRIDLIDRDFSGHIHDYKSISSNGVKTVPQSYTKFRGVMPGWDNSPRVKNNCHIFHGSTPSLYRQWLNEAVTYSRWFQSTPEPAPIFVNAWNEWAESAHLEPDLRYGHAYLAATSEVLASSKDNAVEILKGTPPLHPQAVILHLYDPELAVEFSRHLEHAQVDIWITITDRAVLSVIEPCFPHANILLVANRGRDIAPFLSVLRKISNINYDAVLKVHSSRSHHHLDGDRRREEMLSQLLPDHSDLEQFRKEFLSFPDIGVIGPKGNKCFVREDIGSNQPYIDRLERLTGIATLEDDAFIAGSMYWFRPSALASMLPLPIQTYDFDFEDGQVDGTLAHALERFIGVMARAAGFRICDRDFAMLSAATPASPARAKRGIKERKNL